jgi:hypothetical protein
MNHHLLKEYEQKVSHLLENLHSTEKLYHSLQDEFDTKIKQVEQDRDDKWKQVVSNVESKLSISEGKLRTCQEEAERSKQDFKSLKWEAEQQVSFAQKKMEQLVEQMEALQSHYENEISALKTDVRQLLR